MGHQQMNATLNSHTGLNLGIVRKHLAQFADIAAP